MLVLPYPGLGVTNVIPTPAMQTMAQAIKTQEGYYPGSIAYTDNNPGNLMYAGQPGATAGPGGFAVFATPADGTQALYNQLNLYAQGTCGACNGQPLTIEQMTAIYAPATQAGNNPTVYAQNLAAALGVDPSTPLADVFGGTDLSLNPDNPSDLSATVSIAGVDVPTWGLVAGGVGALLLLMVALQ